MSTPTIKRRPLNAWELPQLLTPMHEHKRVVVKNPKVRPHFVAILAFVYRNRFAIAQQVRRRFKDYLKSDRTARRHLTELESLGWLGVMPTRGTSPLFPKVYFVTPRGARRLRDSLESHGKPGHVIQADRFRRDGFSCDHILHEVLTTEALLMFHECAQANTDLELLKVERRSIPSHPSFQVPLRTRLSRLEPDAWFVHRQRDRGMMLCFLEVDTGSMSARQLKAKFLRYDAWARSSASERFLIEQYHQLGAAHPKARFRIMVIVTCRNSEARRQAVWRAANRVEHVAKRLGVMTTEKIADLPISQLLAVTNWA